MKFSLLLVIGMAFLQSCVVSKDAALPEKFSPAQLQTDFNVFQSMLQDSHPGLYWYTPKDSMDYYFKWGNASIRDSLSEADFRKVLTYVIAKINCGHTSVLSGKPAANRKDSLHNRIFPLSLKLWNDTMVVVANLNRKDSLLTRGTIVKSINDRNFHQMVDSFARYIPSDGYNYTHKLQSLSNRSGFGTAYKNVFGLPKKLDVVFVNPEGKDQHTQVPVFVAVRDTTKKLSRTRPDKPSKKERRKAIRELRIDTQNNVAVMELNSFGRNYGLKKFFKQSFKTLDQKNIQYLVIDVRGNGGGSVTNSTVLTRYISNRKFRIADSLYTVSRKSHYAPYIENYFFNRLFVTLMTKKQRDGYYHFRYFENHLFQPISKHHFDGKVYIITGGNSFSATTLFTQVLREQENVLVVGEETGGGAYGNTAWLIPEATLPNTKIKFRLPLFRLVIDKDLPKNGRGILPEVEVVPNVSAIRQGLDYKMDKVTELIREDQRKTALVKKPE